MSKTFNMTGGKSGGDSGAYAGLTPPAAQLGKNGDYYFKLIEYHRSHNLSWDGNANTGTAGFEFTVSSNMYLYGAAGYARSSYTGEIKFGTSDGTILKTANVGLVANTWVEVLFDEPVLLTPGVNYIVMLFGNQNTLRYALNAPSGIVDPNVNYVRARYGSFPGNTENGSLYSTDILIRDRIGEPYEFNKLYYKSSGAWSEY